MGYDKIGEEIKRLNKRYGVDEVQDALEGYPHPPDDIERHKTWLVTKYRIEALRAASRIVAAIADDSWVGSEVEGYVLDLAEPLAHWLEKGKR